MARILLIEDDPLVVKMYRNVLSFEGFKIETAPNGTEGMKKASEFKPDLIFLDIMMPKMNGIEVLENLKKDPELKKIPIIVLTNLAGADNAEEALKKGAFAYMVKSEYKPKEVAQKAKDFFEKKGVDVSKPTQEPASVAEPQSVQAQPQPASSGSAKTDDDDLTAPVSSVGEDEEPSVSMTSEINKNSDSSSQSVGTTMNPTSMEPPTVTPTTDEVPDTSDVGVSSTPESTVVETQTQISGVAPTPPTPPVTDSAPVTPDVSSLISEEPKTDDSVKGTGLAAEPTPTETEGVSEGASPAVQKDVSETQTAPPVSDEPQPTPTVSDKPQPTQPTSKSEVQVSSNFLPSTKKPSTPAATPASDAPVTTPPVGDSTPN